MGTERSIRPLLSFDRRVEEASCKSRWFLILSSTNERTHSLGWGRMSLLFLSKWKPLMVSGGLRFIPPWHWSTHLDSVSGDWARFGAGGWQVGKENNLIFPMFECNWHRLTVIFPLAHVPKEAGQETEGDTEWSPEGDETRGLGRQAHHQAQCQPQRWRLLLQLSGR